MNLQMLK